MSTRIYFSFIIIIITGLSSCKKRCVLPEPTSILDLKPSNNPDEITEYSYVPNTGYTDRQLSIIQWTVNGAPETWRASIKFDGDTLSQSAVIAKALLYLYATDSAEGGNSPNNPYEPMYGID